MEVKSEGKILLIHGSSKKPLKMALKGSKTTNKTTERLSKKSPSQAWKKASSLARGMYTCKTIQSLRVLSVGLVVTRSLEQQVVWALNKSQSAGEALRWIVPFTGIPVKLGDLHNGNYTKNCWEDLETT